MVKFVQIARWLRGELQAADLALCLTKPAADLRLSQYRPMFVAVGVDHLSEVPGLSCVS